MHMTSTRLTLGAAASLGKTSPPGGASVMQVVAVAGRRSNYLSDSDGASTDSAKGDTVQAHSLHAREYIGGEAYIFSVHATSGWLYRRARSLQLPSRDAVF